MSWRFCTRREKRLVVVCKLRIRLMQSGSGLFGKVSAYVDLKALKISAASSRYVHISFSFIGLKREG